MNKLIGNLLLIVGLLCLMEKNGFGQEKVRYVAIGDSYTIGTGINSQHAWPAWTTKYLKSEGIDIELVGNLGRSGWTSEEIFRHQVPLSLPLKPNFFTVLAGANDIVQNVNKENFVKRFKSLLDRLQKVLPDSQRVLVLTIPDFSVAPYAKNFGSRPALRQRIMVFNAIITKEAQARGLKVVDLFDISQEMGQDLALVASDGLHPSEREHILWAKKIAPQAKELLSNE